MTEGRVLVIHGGLFPEGYRFNDTWRIDLGSSEPVWTQIGYWVLDEGLGLVPGRPAPRFHHTSQMLGRHLVVFGGHDYRREELADSWVLDVLAPPNHPWIPLLGPGPSKRAYQASTVINLRSSRSSSTYRPVLFVHGGSGVDGKLLNDCWILDLDGAEPGWRRVMQQTKQTDTSGNGTLGGWQQPCSELFGGLSEIHEAACPEDLIGCTPGGHVQEGVRTAPRA